MVWLVTTFSIILPLAISQVIISPAGDKEEKPEEKGKMMKVWGLVCCANEECRPYTASKKGLVFPYGIKTYNRDTNAVLNMRYIVECLIKTGKRPIAYTRHK
jgi:hypothetical protein